MANEKNNVSNNNEQAIKVSSSDVLLATKPVVTQSIKGSFVIKGGLSKNSLTTSSEFRVLALDKGFGDTKVTYFNGQETVFFKFRSSLVEVETPLTSDEDTFVNKFTYKYNDDYYVIGGSDVMGNSNHSLDFDFIIGSAPVLIAHAMTLLGITTDDIDVLSVGLPPVENGDEMVRKQYYRAVSSFVVNETTYTFNKVMITSQAIGGLYDYFAIYGNVAGLGVVFDVGFNTVLRAVFNGRKIQGKVNQTNGKGITSIIVDVTNKLKADNGGQPINEMLIRDAFIGNKTVTLFGKMIDLTPIFDKLTTKFVTSTISDFKATYNVDMSRFSSIYLIGGGATYIQSKFPKHIATPIVAINSEYANVRGYLEKALIKLHKDLKK